MTELAKCPLCGAAPSVGATDRAGLSWDISCCDATFVFQSHWNRYVAAMELRERVAWMLEIDRLNHWLVMSNRWPVHTGDKAELINEFECARKAVEDTCQK